MTIVVRQFVLTDNVMTPGFDPLYVHMGDIIVRELIIDGETIMLAEGIELPAECTIVDKIVSNSLNIYGKQLTIGGRKIPIIKDMKLFGGRVSLYVEDSKASDFGIAFRAIKNGKFWIHAINIDPDADSEYTFEGDVVTGSIFYRGELVAGSDVVNKSTITTAKFVRSKGTLHLCDTQIIENDPLLCGAVNYIRPTENNIITDPDFRCVINLKSILQSPEHKEVIDNGPIDNNITAGFSPGSILNFEQLYI